MTAEEAATDAGISAGQFWPLLVGAVKESRVSGLLGEVGWPANGVSPFELATWAMVGMQRPGDDKLPPEVAAVLEEVHYPTPHYRQVELYRELCRLAGGPADGRYRETTHVTERSSR